LAGKCCVDVKKVAAATLGAIESLINCFFASPFEVDAIGLDFGCDGGSTTHLE